MKKLILQYRTKLAQKYADFIIRKLDKELKSDNEIMFNFWMDQGQKLNCKMIDSYDIYLN